MTINTEKGAMEQISVLKDKGNELRLRVISALVAIPAVIFVTYQGPPLFDVMVLMALFGLFKEWSQIPPLYSTTPLYRFLLSTGGYIYLSLSIFIMLILAKRGIEGRLLILWLFCLVWATDIGAYFTGRFLKGPKLAPKISPNKTWSGFVGGILGATIVTVILEPYFKISPLFPTSPMLTAFILSVSAHMGDLLESYIKRRAGIKDSGNLIPGHGGLLDRLDSLLLVSLITGLLLLLK
ncbi:MAG: CDP-archaeol synthase [Alphaproteobacteria bacterium]|nr:CDP-archaeol synthase [Alphaproteobacteria bacterium]